MMPLFSARQAAAPRIEPTLRPAQEVRAASRYSDGWGAVSFGGGASGISANASEGLSAVLSCVGLLSDAAASLPAAVMQETPDGLEPAPATLPACRLIRRPNARQSWGAFVTTMAASILLHGNAVARIELDGRGAVTSLTPVPWPWLAVQVIGGTGGGARLVYDVPLSTPESMILGLPRRLLDSDVVHIRARSDTGIVGRSVISRAAGPVREAVEVNTVAAAMFQNGMRPSAIVSTDQTIDDPTRARLRENMAGYTGAGNTSKVIVLSNGLKFTPVSMSSADAQLLESRKFSVSEICRLFNVPEPLVQVGARPPGDYTPVIAAFAQLALSPLVQAIEDEITAAVLPTGSRLVMDMAGLLRGDYPAVAAAQAVLVQSGIATSNDARRALGLPAHDQGDDLRPNGSAPSYPADAKGVPSLAPKPGPGGVLPNVGTNQNEGGGSG